MNGYKEPKILYLVRMGTCTCCERWAIIDNDKYEDSWCAKCTIEESFEWEEGRDAGWRPMLRNE